jgi:hypothetical protein
VHHPPLSLPAATGRPVMPAPLPRQPSPLLEGDRAGGYLVTSPSPALPSTPPVGQPTLRSGQTGHRAAAGSASRTTVSAAALPRRTPSASDAPLSARRPSLTASSPALLTANVVSRRDRSICVRWRAQDARGDADGRWRRHDLLPVPRQSSSAVTAFSSRAGLTESWPFSFCSGRRPAQADGDMDDAATSV